MLDSLDQYNKIFICGISGSGKTTLAHRISEKFGHTPIYMDEHFWKESWNQRPDAEFFERIDKLSSNEKWVLEGAVRRLIEKYAVQADLVIWLNPPRPIAIYRVLKRSFKYRGKKSRPELPEGCVEYFDSKLFKFIKWIWDYPKNKHAQIRKIFEENDVNYIEVKDLTSCKALL